LSEKLTGIAKRIRREIFELETIRDHAWRRWQKTSGDEDYLGSVAFDLQGFYQGVERVFATIAKSIKKQDLYSPPAVRIIGSPLRRASWLISAFCAPSSA